MNKVITILIIYRNACTPFLINAAIFIKKNPLFSGKVVYEKSGGGVVKSGRWVVGRRVVGLQVVSSGCCPSWAFQAHSVSCMCVKTALKDASSGEQA